MYFERLKYARAKNILVQRALQSLDIRPSLSVSADIVLMKAVIYDEESTNIRIVGVISKVCRNCFFVPAKFVFVPACAEIALTFPISCAADISF